MALTRVSSFVIVAIALGCGYVKASESEFGIDISGADVVAHAGVSADDARSHAAELISEGKRLLESIADYDPPVLRSLRSPTERMTPQDGTAPDSIKAPVNRLLSMGPSKGGYWGNNAGMQGPQGGPSRPMPPPPGAAISVAENTWGDAIADSEAARGGTAVANSRTYSGISIARARSNRRLMMGPSKGGYWGNNAGMQGPQGGPSRPMPPPSGTAIAVAENTWGDAIADSEAARGGTAISNARTYSGTAISRARSNRRLMMGPSKGGYYGGGGQYPSQMGYGRGSPYGHGNYYPGGTSIADARNTWGDAIADSEAARGGTAIANSRTYSGTAIARSRSWRRLHGLE